jgi:hypothetical protein
VGGALKNASVHGYTDLLIYLHGGAWRVESRRDWTDINRWTRRGFYTGRDRMGTNNLTPPSRYSGLDQGRAECEEEPCMDKRFAEYGATFTIIIVPRGVFPLRA